MDYLDWFYNRISELRIQKGVSARDLYIYGLLQALFLQQDAANGISTALLGKKIDFKQEYPSLFEIREIRNDTVGHPTLRGNA